MEPPIVLASPREPSGGSWLINCLLELGVRVNLQPTADRIWRGASGRQRPSDMWQPAENGRWRLNPRAEELKKWLPILGQQETLHFRDDLEVLYVQRLPQIDLASARTVLFVRDPRDAIHSLYQRIQPDMSLEDFVAFPDPVTLLDTIDHWRLFAECWLAVDDTLIYRFEDYKADATGLLSRIVRDLGLVASREEIARAAAESTFEKASAGEEQYRSSHPRDDNMAMRAGRVGEWKTSPGLRQLAREIERRMGLLLLKLGYMSHEEAVSHIESTSQFHFIRAFERIELPSDLHKVAKSSDPMACPRLPAILKLASTADADLMRRARLHPLEARTLFDTLQEYVAAWHDCYRGRLSAARAALDDGADYHMTRIGELMTSRRLAQNLE